MKRLFNILLLILCAAGPARAGSPRHLVVVSDLHFGPGHDAQGRWSAFEDFRWGRELNEFLNELGRRSSAVDLVLNGDTLELWQSYEEACSHPSNLDLGCTEEQALKRTQRIIAEHTEELKRLGAFAATNDNRLFLVPGNHDAALLYPSVLKAVMAAIAAPAGRVVFVASGAYRSADGLVHAEHGHQIGADLNRFEGWPLPFHNVAGIRYLQRPWGEQFVQAFYNQYEERYPIIDNLSSEMAGVRLGTKVEGKLGTLRGASRFLRFLLLEESWEQTKGLLGGKGRKKWDVAAVRMQGKSFLVQSLPSDDPLRAMFDDMLKNGQVDVSMDKTEALSDEEILAICDLRETLSTTHPKGTIITCPTTNLGALKQAALVQRQSVFRKHIAALPDTPERIRLFIFSHTHKAEAFSLKDGPLILNTGAWQRTITPEMLAARAKAKQPSLTAEEAFKRFVPEDLSACYTFIEVGAYAEAPQGKLMRWEQGADGKLSAREGMCP